MISKDESEKLTEIKLEDIKDPVELKDKIIILGEPASLELYAGWKEHDRSSRGIPIFPSITPMQYTNEGKLHSRATNTSTKEVSVFGCSDNILSNTQTFAKVDLTKLNENVTTVFLIVNPKTNTASLNSLQGFQFAIVTAENKKKICFNKWEKIALPRKLNKTLILTKYWKDRESGSWKMKLVNEGARESFSGKVELQMDLAKKIHPKSLSEEFEKTFLEIQGELEKMEKIYTTIPDQVEEIVSRKFQIKCSAKGVDKKDLFSKSDPYFEVESPKRIKVYKSEHLMNTLDPVWKMSSKILLFPDEKLSDEIKISVFDWNKNGKPDYIGKFSVSFFDIKNGKKEFILYNERMKKKKESGKFFIDELNWEDQKVMVKNHDKFDLRKKIDNYFEREWKL